MSNDVTTLHVICSKSTVKQRGLGMQLIKHAGNVTVFGLVFLN